MTLLPIEILLEDGHLTEVALATLADGEEALLPREVTDHARDCEACALALHKEALASVALGALVRAAAGAAPSPVTAPAPALAPAPVPWTLVLAGAATAILGVVLGSLGGSLAWGDLVRDARTLVSMLARGGRAVLFADTPPAVSLGAAVLFVTAALVVMRASPVRRAVSS